VARELNHWQAEALNSFVRESAQVVQTFTTIETPENTRVTDITIMQNDMTISSVEPACATSP
jgi:hypothetical protein